MKSKLSISNAWDETKARIAADGRLFVTVALAMVALPAAIGQFAVPGSGVTRAPQSAGEIILMIAIWVIGVIGQLALIRLAIGPSVSVGEAIGHGARRALAYIGAMILIIAGALLLSVPFIAALAAAGVSFAPGAAAPPWAYIAILLLMALLVYLAVRLMMTSPVASAERAGPIAILKRSWELTRGNALRLLGFLLLFVIGVIILVAAVSVVTSLVITLIFGPVEPLTASALIIALVEAIASALVTAIFVVMLARIYVQLTGNSEAETSVPSSGT